VCVCVCVCVCVHWLQSALHIQTSRLLHDSCSLSMPVTHMLQMWPTSQDLISLATDPAASLVVTPQSYVEAALARSASQADAAPHKDVVVPTISPSSSPPALLTELCQTNSLSLSQLTQFELLWVFRLLSNFGNLETRCSCLRVRLVAISACGVCVHLCVSMCVCVCVSLWTYVCLLS
jgi:hypothetical protein